MSTCTYNPGCKPVIDNFIETTEVVSTLAQVQDTTLLGRMCELYIQSILSGYVRLARYSRKGTTRREAELCGESSSCTFTNGRTLANQGA